MSSAVLKTIAILEQEVEAIEQRRGELLRAIESLRPLADEDASPRRSKKAVRRNERTNERTNEQSAGQRVGASLT